MILGVAVVTALFPPSVGGIQRHTWEMSRKLAKRGVRVHVVTRAMEGLPRFQSSDGVSIHRVGSSRAKEAMATVLYVGAALQRLHALRKELHLVHAHQLLSPTTIALLAQRTLRVPVLLNPHASGAVGDVAVLQRGGALGRARLREALERADGVVSISSAIRKALLEMGMGRERIFDLPNGVDIDWFRPPRPDERSEAQKSLGPGPWVVFHGRLAPEKGVDLLLDGWGHVLERVPEAKLLIVGDGPNRAAFCARSRSFGSAVRLVGAREDVRSFLWGADVAVLPSRSEGLPVALLESMACGLPVVATAVGGTRDVMIDDLTGRLVAPNRPQEMAEAICEALLTERARHWAHAARSRVERQFSIEDKVEELLNIYQYIAAAERPGNAQAGLQA